MLTVKIIDQYGSEFVYEAQRVNFLPSKGDSPDQSGHDASLHILGPNREHVIIPEFLGDIDSAKEHIHGPINAWVMNSHGATVAKYEF